MPSIEFRRWRRLRACATGLFLVHLATLGIARAELLDVGDEFPAWSLRDHTGAQRSSDELSGRTYLVWFYPAAMTPG